MHSPLRECCGAKGKGLTFLTVLGYLDILMEKQMTLGPYLTTITQRNSRRSADMNWEGKTLKLPGGK